MQNWIKAKCNELFRGFTLLGSYPMNTVYRGCNLLPEQIAEYSAKATLAIADS
jgi:hypothetical protein